LKHFLNTHQVKQAHISIAANKDGAIKMTTESIAQAILFVSDPANYPVYIHCNQGKHRTGCVIACLRKCQQVPLHEVLEEYKTYAYPKERPGDIAFIKAFDPQCLEQFADRKVLNERFPGAYRVDSKTDMLEYASSVPAALPSSGSSSSEGTQFSSGESDVSAEDLTLVFMTRPPPVEQPVSSALALWTGEMDGGKDEDDQRMMVEKCEKLSAKDAPAVEEDRPAGSSPSREGGDTHDGATTTS
jgi:hypothetical protein